MECTLHCKYTFAFWHLITDLKPTVTSVVHFVLIHLFSILFCSLDSHPWPVPFPRFHHRFVTDLIKDLKDVVKGLKHNKNGKFIILHFWTEAFLLRYVAQATFQLSFWSVYCCLKYNKYMSPGMGEYFFFHKNYRRLLDTNLIETAHSPTALLTQR